MPKRLRWRHLDRCGCPSFGGQFNASCVVSGKCQNSWEGQRVLISLYSAPQPNRKFERDNNASHHCPSTLALGRMETDEITALVTGSASRFGDRSPQQLKQLASRLRKAHEARVLQGLLKVFTHGEPAPVGSAAQELSGKLLAELRPIGPLELKSVLRESLCRYERSVEQFPQYLAAACGSSAVLVALQELEHEPISELERRALQTMRFWLRNSPTAGGQNAA